MTEFEKTRDEAAKRRVSPPEQYGDIGPICYPWILNSFKMGADWARNYLDNGNHWHEHWLAIKERHRLQSKAIDKLMEIAHCDCEYLGVSGNKLPCHNCKTLVEIKEMMND